LTEGGGGSNSKGQILGLESSVEPHELGSLGRIGAETRAPISSGSQLVPDFSVCFAAFKDQVLGIESLGEAEKLDLLREISEVVENESPTREEASNIVADSGRDAQLRFLVETPDQEHFPLYLASLKGTVFNIAGLSEVQKLALLDQMSAKVKEVESASPEATPGESDALAREDSDKHSARSTAEQSPGEVPASEGPFPAYLVPFIDQVLAVGGTSEAQKLVLLHQIGEEVKNVEAATPGITRLEHSDAEESKEDVTRGDPSAPTSFAEAQIEGQFSLGLAAFKDEVLAAEKLSEAQKFDLLGRISMHVAEVEFEATHVSKVPDEPGVESSTKTETGVAEPAAEVTQSNESGDRAMAIGAGSYEDEDDEYEEDYDEDYDDVETQG